MSLLFAILIVGSPISELDCQVPMGSNEINECARRRLEIADEALNNQWPKTLKAIKKLDEQNKELKPTLTEALLLSQRAWKQHRNNTCYVAGFAEADGQQREQIEADCKAIMTRYRAEELKIFVEGLSK